MIDFRHNLPKQQKQEGEQDGHEKKFQQNDYHRKSKFTEKEIQQHDDSHIHEIVGYQNCSQQTLRIFL